MTSSGTTPSVTSVQMSQDDRREWVRIEDRVLMEYRLSTERENGHAGDARGSTTADMIAAAVMKPTADLLARSSDSLDGSPILPWIMKVDYLLEVILHSLAVMQPSSVSMARPTDVSLSGGGVGFVSPREFATGDQLAITLILPPFLLIQVLARVIRSVPQARGLGFETATEFVDLKPDDQEHLIRHILQTQAEQLRARRNQAG